AVDASEIHGLPAVLGPVAGPGNRALTVAVRSAMPVELACLSRARTRHGYSVRSAVPPSRAAQLWVTGGPASWPRAMALSRLRPRGRGAPAGGGWLHFRVVELGLPASPAGLAGTEGATGQDAVDPVRCPTVPGQGSN